MKIVTCILISSSRNFIWSVVASVEGKLLMGTTDLKAKYPEKLVGQILEKVAAAELAPTRLPDGSYTYKIIEELDPNANQGELLDYLTSKGYLEPVLLETALVCPNCKRPSSYAVMSCQKCGSMRITRDRLIEHRPFGHLHPESKFQKDRKLVCPTCGRTLSGKDDMKFVGTWFNCLECGEKTSKSTFKFECLFDGTIFTSNDSDIRQVYKYVIGKQTSPVVAVSAKSSIVQMIKQYFGREFTVQEDPSVTGKSGIAHIFDLAISVDKAKRMYVDIRQAGEPIGNTEVLAGYAKVLDTQTKNYVLVAWPSLNNSGKALADSYQMRYVEVSSIDQARDKLNDFIRQKLLT
jgi:hypothetical protein